MVMGRLPEEYLRDLGAAADQRDEVTPGQTEPVHVELDSVDHGGEADLHSLRLVELDEVDQNVKFDTSGVIGIVNLPFRTRQRIHEFFDPNHCCPVVILIVDRPDGNHVYTSFALMRSYSAWGPIQRM